MQVCLLAITHVASRVTVPSPCREFAANAPQKKVSIWPTSRCLITSLNAEQAIYHGTLLAFLPQQEKPRVDCTHSYEWRSSFKSTIKKTVLVYERKRYEEHAAYRIA